MYIVLRYILYTTRIIIHYNKLIKLILSSLEGRRRKGEKRRRGQKRATRGGRRERKRRGEEDCEN